MRSLHQVPAQLADVHERSAAHAFNDDSNRRRVLVFAGCEGNGPDQRRRAGLCNTSLSGWFAAPMMPTASDRQRRVRRRRGLPQPWGSSRGNPVRIRDCPAAVCGNDRRHQHWASAWEAPATRNPTSGWACPRVRRPATAPCPSGRGWSAVLVGGTMTTGSRAPQSSLPSCALRPSPRRAREG